MRIQTSHPLGLDINHHKFCINMNCVFCDIVKGRVPCHKIWENDEHLAFLSIFPNTKGFSVVITKEHFSSYAFG